MTPTQLFRAALTLDRTQQTFRTLDRFDPLDTVAANTMLRRNVRDAAVLAGVSDTTTRYRATGLLMNYYLDSIRPLAHGRTTQLTE